MSDSTYKTITFQSGKYVSTVPTITALDDIESRLSKRIDRLEYLQKTRNWRSKNRRRR